MYATVPTTASFAAKVHFSFDITQVWFFVGMVYLSFSAFVS